MCWHVEGTQPWAKHCPDDQYGRGWYAEHWGAGYDALNMLLKRGCCTHPPKGKGPDPLNAKLGLAWLLCFLVNLWLLPKQYKGMLPRFCTQNMQGGEPASQRGCSAWMHWSTSDLYNKLAPGELPLLLTDVSHVPASSEGLLGFVWRRPVVRHACPYVQHSHIRSSFSVWVALSRT